MYNAKTMNGCLNMWRPSHAMHAACRSMRYWSPSCYVHTWCRPYVLGLGVIVDDLVTFRGLLPVVQQVQLLKEVTLGMEVDSSLQQSLHR